MKIQGKHIILFISLLLLIYINYLCYLTYLEYPSLKEFFNKSIWMLFILIESITLTILIGILIVIIIQKYWDEDIHINFKLRKR